MFGHGVLHLLVYIDEDLLVTPVELLFVITTGISNLINKHNDSEKRQMDKEREEWGRVRKRERETEREEKKKEKSER